MIPDLTSFNGDGQPITLNTTDIRKLNTPMTKKIIPDDPYAPPTPFRKCYESLNMSTVSALFVLGALSYSLVMCVIFTFF